MMLRALVGNTVRAVLWPLLALRRHLVVPGGAWVSLTLEGPVSEIERPLPRIPNVRELLLRGRPKQKTTVAGLRRLGRALCDDDRVAGVLLRIDALECGWAVAVSLREWIASLRAGGKRVVAWLPDGASPREYFVALAAEKIVAGPASSLSPLGFASGITFVRGLLARGGIDAEVFARREFKSAAESLTRDSYSEANRMQTEALLDTLYDTMLGAMVSGRGLDETKVRALLEGGPFGADDAKAEGLVDAVAYEDELPTALGHEKLKLIPAARFLVSAMATDFRAIEPSRRVAVVEVRGLIVSKANGGLGEMADARSIIAALRLARRDPTVGAVVLHIDSSGGSALASDQIAREVERLAEKKKVVAYFSNVAASGGYYIAALAHEIVAQPTTVTGSIGVIAIRFQAVRALEKLDLRREVIRRGERADLNSPYRALNAGDREAIDREIDAFYTRFVAIVARGRQKRVEVIEPLARGRVYAGRDALAAGLVDQLGGFDLAVTRAKDLAGGRFAEAPVVLMALGETPPAAEVKAAVPEAVWRVVEGLGIERAELDWLSLSLSAPTEHLFALCEAPRP